MLSQLAERADHVDKSRGRVEGSGEAALEAMRKGEQGMCNLHTVVVHQEREHRHRIKCVLVRHRHDRAKEIKNVAHRMKLLYRDCTGGVVLSGKAK